VEGKRFERLLRLGLAPHDRARLLDMFREMRRFGFGMRRSLFVSLFALGVPAGRIARVYGRSEGTVRNHFKEVYPKLGLRSRTELTMLLSGSSVPGQQRGGPEDQGLRLLRGRRSKRNRRGPRGPGPENRDDDRRTS